MRRAIAFTTVFLTLHGPGLALSQEILDEARFAELVRQPDGLPGNGTVVELPDGAEAYLSLPVPGGDQGSGWPAVVLVDASLRLDRAQRLWADRLAAAGFAALAIDLEQPREYPVATSVPEVPADDRRDPRLHPTPTGPAATPLARAVDPERARAILRQAAAYLRGDARVRAPRVAALGWSQGADWVLRAACQDGDYDALVLYYGRVETDLRRLRGLNASILGLYGRTDRHHPPSIVGRFEELLEQASVRAELRILDACHGFAEPDRAAYEARAAEQAWGEVCRFLTRELF